MRGRESGGRPRWVGGWQWRTDDIESNDRGNNITTKIGSGRGLANGVIQYILLELKASFSQTLTTILRVVTTKTKAKPKPEGSQPPAAGAHARRGPHDRA